MLYLVYLILIAINVALVFLNQPTFAVWNFNLAVIGFLIGLGSAKLITDLVDRDII